MKAAVLFKTGEPLKIIDGIQMPSLQRGQVLVKISYSGICHSQLMEVNGDRGEDKWVPHLLGHEATGVVQSIGADVTRVKVGDKVILGWVKAKGLSVAGAKYQWNDQIINSGGVTTFSTHTIASEDRCYQLPEFIPMDVGVLFGCALPTGAGIVFNELKPEAGKTIVIFGLGGIGMSALIASLSLNLKTVIAIDISDEKLKFAKNLGATETLLATRADLQEAVFKITEGQGVDYCVEAAGLTSTIEMAFSLLNPKSGKLIFASHPKNGQKISIDPYELISGKQIAGSWGGAFSPDQDIPRLAQLFLTKKESFLEMVEKRYRLDDINKALTDLANKKVVRPIIEMSL
ncbi:MAG: zinc-binding dehydrogenase [Bdellovibrionaceae bacterium]|nr:zinc-binding dehydrogenase [Bdellovibrio sp.]